MSVDAAPAAYQRAAGATSQREMLARLELSPADFARVREHCRTRGIAFLATPFSPTDVDRLVALGAAALKIASPDLVNPVLLDRAVATGLPLIVSTGAATRAEIRTAVARLRAAGAAARLILLHCVSGYPAPLGAANLRAIESLRRLAGVPCGFSDHTGSTAIAGWAVAAGACVLEKHFTLDRTAPGPDHAMSLGPAELAEYVRAARQAESALGDGQLGFSDVEADVRQVARRRVVAARPIARGATITADMLALKRPAGGIPPAEFEQVVGCRSRVAVAADAPLNWSMLEPQVLRRTPAEHSAGRA